MKSWRFEVTFIPLLHQITFFYSLNSCKRIMHDNSSCYYEMRMRKFNFWRIFLPYSDKKEQELAERGGVGQEKKTLMQYILILSPFSLYSLLFVYPAFYFLDMDIPILMISSFSVASRNFFTISGCIIIEFLFQSVYITWIIYIFFILLSFVMTLIEFIDFEIRRIYRE